MMDKSGLTKRLQALLGQVFKRKAVIEPASFAQPPRPVIKPVEPQPADLDELLAYLPLLYPDGVAIKTSFFNEHSQWPSYVEVVHAFYSAAGKECWTDYEYDTVRCEEMLGDPRQVAEASLDECKSLLTWCVRGERFCDGHHGSVIENDYILSLLQRLRVLRQAYPNDQ